MKTTSDKSSDLAGKVKEVTVTDGAKKDAAIKDQGKEQKFVKSTSASNVTPAKAQASK